MAHSAHSKFKEMLLLACASFAENLNLLLLCVQIEGLLTRYQSLVVALPLAETLTRKQEEAQQWTRRAETLLAKPLSRSLAKDYEASSI